MKKIFITLLVCFALKPIHAQLLQVKLQSLSSSHSMLVTVEPNTYQLELDSVTQILDSSISAFHISPDGDSLRIKTLDQHIYKAVKLKLTQVKPTAFISIKIPNSNKIKNYYGDLELTLVNRKFHAINQVNLEKYLPGVVEAEAGNGAPYEFFKVQSIIARTYVMSHLRRHESEGFNVCDQVHCQVYKGKTNNPKIIQANQEIEGLVLVDSTLQPITAAFHSNSGGITCASEIAWAQPLPYLKAVSDTFSLQSPNAAWEKKITTQEWLNYIKQKNAYAILDSSVTDSLLNFKTQTRCKYVCVNTIKLDVNQIRTDFKLKSAWFDLVTTEEATYFKGRGYGHGVGLSQEGAIEMAKQNKSYQEILHHYYQNIQLVNLNVLSYFKQE